MPHSAESRLPAMHSAEFLERISSPTTRYATQREIQLKILWSSPEQHRVDSTLCSIVRSCDSSLCSIAQSCNSALCRIVRSQHKFAISPRNQNQSRKYFRMIISDLGRLVKKNRGSKTSRDCPFKACYIWLWLIK
jgi:hypothetical protein